MSNRANKARSNLKERQYDFDLNIASNVTKARAFKRPGSQNAHKQGAGSVVKGKRR